MRFVLYVFAVAFGLALYDLGKWAVLAAFVGLAVAGRGDPGSFWVGIVVLLAAVLSAFVVLVNASSKLDSRRGGGRLPD